MYKKEMSMGYKILSKKELCPNQFEITVDAPYVVRNAKAGQFIIFRATKNKKANLHLYLWLLDIQQSSWQP